MRHLFAFQNKQQQKCSYDVMIGILWRCSVSPICSEMTPHYISSSCKKTVQFIFFSIRFVLVFFFCASTLCLKVMRRLAFSILLRIHKLKPLFFVFCFICISYKQHASLPNLLPLAVYQLIITNHQIVYQTQKKSA